jgi:hypothetical protein
MRPSAKVAALDRNRWPLSVGMRTHGMLSVNYRVFAKHIYFIIVVGRGNVSFR